MAPSVLLEPRAREDHPETAPRTPAPPVDRLAPNSERPIFASRTGGPRRGGRTAIRVAAVALGVPLACVALVGLGLGAWPDLALWVVGARHHHPRPVPARTAGAGAAAARPGRGNTGERARVLESHTHAVPARPIRSAPTRRPLRGLAAAGASSTPVGLPQPVGPTSGRRRHDAASPGRHRAAPPERHHPAAPRSHTHAKLHPSPVIPRGGRKSRRTTRPAPAHRHSPASHAPARRRVGQVKGGRHPGRGGA